MNKRTLLIFGILLPLTLLSAAELATQKPDTLAQGFASPPDSAKPQTWWHWMNGNITKEGITADLEAMKQIGLGGATIVNVDCGIPHGPVDFMSPEWRDNFKFAIAEANRLGLELTVENCAGWSSSGGPWNTPESAMQQVVSSELSLTGPTNFSSALPSPPTKLGFYRDIAVLAYPVSDTDGVSMKDFSPVTSASSDSASAAKILDGDDQTFVTLLPSPKPDKPQFVQLAFARPFAARTVKIVGDPGMPECNGEVQVSEDGKSFRAVQKFAFRRRNSGPCVAALGSEPVTGRFWRMVFIGAGPKATAATISVAEVSLEQSLSINNLGRKIAMDIGVGIGQAEVTSDRDASLNPGGAVQRRDIIDLTSRLTADGRLNWQASAGKWTVLRFGYTPTGAKNHPAAPEATGLECDKFSTEALDAHWAGFMKKVLDDIKPLGGRGLAGALIDSYEVGGQTWTKNFREEFQKRRGYDLLTYLPVFIGRVVDNPAVTERFLWDLRRTIADLIANNYFGHFAELCHSNGLISAVEPYTGPFESMQSGANADFVMGEFWSGRKGHSSIKMVSSIAHIYGKTFVGAESFTAAPKNAGRWTEDPYSLKTLGDLMYCQGLNRYVFHRYAMQPWTNRWPGMTMGPWGFHFERTQTWWHPGKAWIDYISRCQFLLQQGRSIQDAAYYSGQSAPVAMRIDDPKLPDGYDFDAVNADVLLHGATVKNGRLTLASGANYAALILPAGDPDMTPQFLERLSELVHDGATIVGAPPKKSPSLADFPDCDAEVKKLAAQMWGNCDGNNVLENSYGKGHVFWGKPMSGIFAAQHLKPDFEFAGTDAESNMAYVHRVTGEADIYFVSNQRHETDSLRCTFRVSGKTPELWHPDTGVIERAPVWHEQDGRTIVDLNFDPAGSVFVVFRSAASGNQIVTAKANSKWQIVSGANGELLVKATSNGTAAFTTAEGKTLQATAANIPAPREISGSWILSFPPNWGAPPSVTLDKLISWPDHPDKGVKYFSGTASYEKDIDIPAGSFQPGREFWLDMGAVKNFAEVFLNDQNLGVLWKPPFRANLTPAVKPGVNKLVVKVTNLWPNRLIGDEQLPPDVEWNGKQIKEWPQWFLDGKPSPTGRLTFTTWQHWMKDSPLLESGLLGPVTLQTAQTIVAAQPDRKSKL
ncbi:MAG: glycosyl hydrolase [Verrucomicrobiota bacterium]